MTPKNKTKRLTDTNNEVAVRLSRVTAGTIISIIILFICTNCSTTGSGLPSTSEQSAIENGERSLVLFRLKTEFVDGTKVQPYFCGSGLVKVRESTEIPFYIGFAESPIVGGEVDRSMLTRFLSQQSCRDGWSYILLEHGRHFITFQGPQMADDRFTWNNKLRYLPRWQVDIPSDTPVVYIGTLHLTTSGYEHYVIFKGNIREWSDYIPSMSFISDEEEIAENIVKETLGSSMPVATSLMKRL
jgi:hypothetical protein